MHVGGAHTDILLQQSCFGKWRPGSWEPEATSGRLHSTAVSHLHCWSTPGPTAASARSTLNDGSILSSFTADNTAGNPWCSSRSSDLFLLACYNSSVEHCTHSWNIHRVKNLLQNWRDGLSCYFTVSLWVFTVKAQLDL